IQDVRGNDVAMIFQEPMMALNPLHKVEKQITESLTLHQGFEGAKARAKVKELLDLVSFENVEQMCNRYPHELSGGQRQRVMIAVALACSPKLLIADEPTTALDVTTQSQILDLLKDLQKKLSMSLLLITHDFHVVRSMADRVLVMQEGCIVERGPLKEVFSTPQHDYTKHLLSCVPSGAPEPVLTQKQVIEVKNLKVAFPIRKGFFRKIVDHHVALEDLSFDLRQGETLGIVGESGSGKTTAALALLRLIQKTGGNAVYQGQDLFSLPQSDLKALRQKMQIVFQDPFASLNPRLTVGDIVEEGLRAHHPKMGRPDRQKKVCEALESVGLDPEFSHRYPHEFSGGQRQRIAIARALILNPEFIIFDEPTSALDRSTQLEIIDLLRDLQKHQGLSYLFISHDLAVVRALSHRVIVLKNGRVIEQGSAENVFKNPQDPYTQELVRSSVLSA
ncbi:MAG: ABC transporter ATP-binding protein, partial [bacterium]|nr:ABC transporter ATP-binding protein [bacterium]